MLIGHQTDITSCRFKGQLTLHPMWSLRKYIDGHDCTLAKCELRRFRFSCNINKIDTIDYSHNNRWGCVTIHWAAPAPYMCQIVLVHAQQSIFGPNL